MATAAIIGVSVGKCLLSSSVYYSDITDKLYSVHHDHGLIQYQTVSPITAKKSTHFGPSFPHDRHTQPLKTIQEHINALAAAAVTAESVSSHKLNCVEEESFDVESSSLEALLLLQKSMLEKQWNLSFERKGLLVEPKKQNCKKVGVIKSGISARQRRYTRKYVAHNSNVVSPSRKKINGSIVSPDLLANRSKSYVKGVLSEELLTHAEVVHLSKKIKAGLFLEDYKSKLKKRLGYNPSDEQLATSLKISRAELQSKLIECSLAKERLAMSNVRLVMSIAQKYHNMGAEMADLVQGGLIGLVRGIEKFDSSKGFKISTYVYWWIRQGVSRALVENSRTLRLPTHLHERLSLIRNAKIRLENKGITPSIERIAESLNISQKKVRNATEAITKYIADTRLENNPWHGVDEWTLKDEVNNLIKTTLTEREQDIVRLYYGLDKECLTWEDISRRIGLSRERVRQVGLVALEKLKHAARRRKLEVMLVKH
ncbi:hypothetical protein AQUCO_05200048v1 [Aquilegia coerulea]|uniref:RNA polymerase sigma-70 domain-containing protein n=1 Tax=Aquilegia coerulea TaxID=218851 RepID=A0A2G5CIT4_AQUCA|nr:hypothetical protein AQUCO_05200048v1 [Aquilegia coerulea]